MKSILSRPSYSLKDFRLLPGYSGTDHGIDQTCLKTAICGHDENEISLQLPFLSAAMQAVTGVEMAIALAELGGVGVLPIDESIENQVQKVQNVKRFKAGFQTDLRTCSPDQKIGELCQIMRETGYSTFPVTDTGIFHGKLLGIITDKDFDHRFDGELTIEKRMKKDLKIGIEIDDLKEANELMIKYGHGFLPIVSHEGTLTSVVFKKDLDLHLKHPDATIDKEKRLRVGAAVSTHAEDRERISQLIRNDTDFLVIDSSDGFSCFQEETVKQIKKQTSIPVIGGNIVTADAFMFLANAGVDGIKVGMGVGSGCTTQMVKATGRGQASALIDVINARNQYALDGRYIPVVADGGINSPLDISIALSIGADAVMMGNYFAGFNESASESAVVNGRPVKEYWMEASARSYNYRRYSRTKEWFFEEGIEGFVPAKGSIYDTLPIVKRQLKSTLGTVGVRSLNELRDNAVLELQTSAAQTDSGIHNIIPMSSNELC